MIETGQGPALLAAVSVWFYWAAVLLMAARLRLMRGGRAGLLPAAPIERLMWIFWVPVIVGWNLFPLFSINQSAPIWQLPADAVLDPGWLALRWVAAAVVALCLLATVYCWRWMGKNWRVGVDTNSTTTLITDGPFSRVRHPIYALSIAMMGATLLAVPTFPMLIVATLHILLMHFKAANEEAWMGRQTEVDYAGYKAQTGRFLPRLRNH